MDVKSLSKFQQLEVLSRSVVEGFLTGLHRSPFKGFAVEFAEHREYNPGDDIKHLDWKLYAKKDRYYVKQYDEDTSLRAYIVVDASGSMDYTSSDKFTKFDYARFTAGVFTYLLTQQRDVTGLVTFDDAIRDYLPPGSTDQHFKKVLDTLGDTKPGKDTNLGDVLHTLADKIRRRALIVILSDFFDDFEKLRLALNHFAYKKHEVVVYQILDRTEAEFPFKKLTRFDSLEDEEKLLIDPVRLQRAYLKHFKRPPGSGAEALPQPPGRFHPDLYRRAVRAERRRLPRAPHAEDEIG